jgi:hypothetical protein
MNDYIEKKDIDHSSNIDELIGVFVGVCSNRHRYLLVVQWCSVAPIGAAFFIV